MPTIIEIPDDPRYTIKSVSSQTGIRPVTLRAWERRYHLLEPKRGDNRYRLYSERDVAILQWVKKRLDEGLSISSAVNEFHGMQKADEWPEAVETVPAIPRPHSAEPPEKYVEPLYDALIRHDEEQTAALMKEIFAGYDLLTVSMRIISPVMMRIGEAWYNGRISITTEHFASAYLRGKLLSLLQAYPCKRNAPSFLVGSGPNEQHEIGALMFAALLRTSGYCVEFLGPDIPLDDLADYAGEENADMVILSASMESTALELKKMQEKLNKLRHPPLFGFAGGAFAHNPELIKAIPGHYLGPTMQDALAQVAELMEQRAAVTA